MNYATQFFNRIVAFAAPGARAYNLTTREGVQQAFEEGFFPTDKGAPRPTAECLADGNTSRLIAQYERLHPEARREPRPMNPKIKADRRQDRKANVAHLARPIAERAF